MRKIGLAKGITLLILTVPIVFGAEDFIGNLDKTSTGFITINLEITEDISAGFIKTNLDNPDSELNEQLSTQLVQSITNDADTILPFCVISSGGGYFEVTSYEPTQNLFFDDSDDDTVFGNTVPLEISFGEDELSSIKYHSVTDGCDPTTAIPVTINLNERYSGADVGRIHGKFNLLVKSE